MKEHRKGPKIMVRVLRGTLAEGDEVELTHADGSGQSARIIDIGKHPLTPDSYLGKWYRQDGAPADLFRAGDLLLSPDAGPITAPDEPTGILIDIAEARAVGRIQDGAHLPDAVIALHLQHAMEAAIKGSTGANMMSGQFQEVARVLDRYGLTEHADRARIVASAALEGYKPGAAMRGLASVAAGVVNAATTFKDPLLVSGIGLALEQGDAFASSYKSSLRVTGEGIRLPIQQAGRAKALGWCRKCRDVRPLDLKLKCETCGKKVADDAYSVAVIADLPVIEAELRAAHAR
jgi:hypothetical protein